MKIRHGHAPLLLLFLPSLAIASSTSGTKVSNIAKSAGDDSIDTLDAAPLGSTVNAGNSKARVADVSAKVPPVEDGMPHEGPFVTVPDKGRKKGADVDADDELPPLKGRPVDPTIIDGKKIPETNDGVMDDPHRKPPKEGTTGTEGGVSEKDKARKAKEGRTGEKVEMVPETPKEKPPLPHSEQEKMGEKDTKADKEKSKSDKSSDDIAGLEVCS